MSKIGLIAGGGMLPVEFVRSVRDKGDRCVVFALKGMALENLNDVADKIYWFDVTQYKIFIFTLIKERVRNIALLGKVDKNIIYNKDIKDKEVTNDLDGLKDKKDYSILAGVTRHLERFGIHVIDTSRYLSHLMPKKGLLTDAELLPEIEADMDFGYKIAKQMADMDIGQTIVVKHKSVVAVEAMEGTDAVIKRAGQIAGEGCVMIKVSRSDQDLRWDVPVVGTETMDLLSENKFRALAIENGKMYLVDRENFLKKAEEADISVKAL